MTEIWFKKKKKIENFLLCVRNPSQSPGPASVHILNDPRLAFECQDLC